MTAARCFSNGYWVNDQQRLPQPAAWQKTGQHMPTCAPTCCWRFRPPEMQVVRSTREARGNPAEGFRLPCPLSSHFCFQSFRDNVAHQNKKANGQERGKERLVWKSSGLEKDFFFCLFSPPRLCIRLFQSSSTPEIAKVRLAAVSWFSEGLCSCAYRLGRGLPAWLCFHHAFSASLVSSCSSHHCLGCACST